MLEEEEEGDGEGVQEASLDASKSDSVLEAAEETAEAPGTK